MKRKILILLFMLTGIQTYSQIEKFENIYFIKFKVYQKDFAAGVPFAEIGISDKKDDYIVNCATTDINGYAYFYINPNKYNIDSTFLRIRILKGNTHTDYGKPIIIPLNQIELLKDFNFENDLRIALTDYKVLSVKEYKKQKKKYGLMPERQPTKAANVR